MPYRTVEGIAMADVAFEATGRTLEEMLASAAEAVTSTMIKNPGTLAHKIEKKISIDAKDEEFLLHDFLEELLFLKDAELLLFGKYELKVGKGGKGLKLSGTLKGEHLDQKKHELLVDAKAISWHMLKVEKSAKEWKAFFIVDV
jgi:SHS2 domain-containing protein